MKNHAVVLLDLIKSHGFRTMIEIGICRGDCAKVILEGTQKPYEFFYYGIDSYKPYPEYDASVDVNAHPSTIHRNKVKAVKNLAPFIQHNRVSIFELTSKEAFPKFKKGSTGLVFIDGNHSYEYVKQDLNLYWCKLTNYGIMAVHDYGHPNFPGVKEAVDEFVEEHELTLHNEGDVWYFYNVKL